METQNPFLDAKRRWREYHRKGPQSESRFRLGLAASFTVEPLVPYLGTELLDLEFQPDFDIAPFGQVFNALLSPESVFPDFPAYDMLVIFWRIEDILGQELSAFVDGDQSALEAALTKTAELVAASGSLQANYKGILAISAPAFPHTTTITVSDIVCGPRAGIFHRAVVSAFMEGMQAQNHITVFDMDTVLRDCGTAGSFDVRKWYLYKQPYSERFYMELAGLLSRLVKVKTRAEKKCIVLDIDNTIWGGVIGEDGIGGIGLGDDFPGSAFRDFQKLLLSYHDRGIMLAVCSKNNEEDVFDVFKNHDAMMLKKKHLAAWQINWLPKPENIKSLAKELNIGLDSLVFIDDSDFEINAVRQELPQVTCLQVPQDPAELVATVRDCRLFDKISITAEDTARTAMMTQERERKTVRSSMSHEEYLASLNLHVDIFPAQESHLARITQLINKTNQFNLTTIRRTDEEVRELFQDPNYLLLAMRASDRFGDYGMTGVAVVQLDRPLANLDTFLMSCRIIGRGIETAFLRKIVESAAGAGSKTLIGKFVPTRKNKPVENFLSLHGFKQSDCEQWELDTSQPPEMPQHISYDDLQLTIAD